MATYKLNPDTGQVSGTNSDMPLLVKPSVLEMGSLTLAQAQSSRFYSDASLTTELAREVVSADVIWVKVPSATSATEIWMDYDGVRSDYATSATYGAQNVWSDAIAAYHMGDLTTSTVLDSSGNRNGNKNSANNPIEDSLQIGAAQLYDGSNDTIEAATQINLNDTTSFSCWFESDNVATEQRIIAVGDAVGGNQKAFGNVFSLQIFSSGIRAIIGTAQAGSTNRIITGSEPISSNTKYHVALTWNGTDAKVYLNGVLEQTGTNAATNIDTSSLDLWIGAREDVTVGVTSRFDGHLDECVLDDREWSADYVATQYNNQNDNAAFWVATEVGTTTRTGSLRKFSRL